MSTHGVLFEPQVVSSTPDESLGEEDMKNNSARPPDSFHSRFSKPKKREFRMRGFVSIYQDDIICFSHTAEEHKAHLEKLFRVLSEEHIPLNIQKPHLFCRTVRYLGAICGNGHIWTDPEKVSAIDKMTVKPEITSIR